MRKTLKITVAALLLAGFAVYVINTLSFDFSFDGATQAHTAARTAFLSDLPASDCLRSEDIITVAKARDWNVRSDPDFDWCVRPANIVSWLRVTISPGLPFSTEDENAQMFAFDSNGCAVDWAYASGAGTTCPD